MARNWFITVTLFAAALIVRPHDCLAQQLGQDAGRLLVERLESVRDFPPGHPRVYELPGYAAYRPAVLLATEGEVTRRAKRSVIRRRNRAIRREARERRQSAPATDNRKSPEAGSPQADNVAAAPQAGRF